MQEKITKKQLAATYAYATFATYADYANARKAKWKEIEQLFIKHFRERK